MIKWDTVTGPAFLASALVNGDTSGLDAAGLECLARFEAWIAPGYVVDVARDADGEANEPRFTWSFDLHGGDTAGGDVVDYVVHTETDDD
jgi:hypothetical protein